MEKNLSKANKLILDLSFTPYLVQDLDSLKNNKTLELTRNPNYWNQEIARWIKFIQLNDELKCPKIVRTASKLSLGLELTDDKKISDLNNVWLGQPKCTDVLSFPIIDETSFIADIECIELGDIVISVPTAKKQAEENNVDLFLELRWLATHGLLHLLGWDHCDEKSLNQMLITQEQLLNLRGIL